MTVLRAVDRAFEAAERVALFGALAVMLVLGLGQVLLRNVLHTGWPPGDLIARHLVLVIAFAGGSHAAGQGRHLHIEIISRFLPGRLRAVATVLTQLGAALVCALLARAGWGMMLAERQGGDVLLAGIPTWWATAMFPAGFSLLSLRFLLHVTTGETGTSPSPRA